MPMKLLADAGGATVAFAVIVSVCFSCYFIKFILLERLASFIFVYDMWFSRLARSICDDDDNSNKMKMGATTTTTMAADTETTTVCEYDAIFENEYLPHIRFVEHEECRERKRQPLSVVSKIT